MPKITGHKQAFSLYSPKLRPQEFPRANWQFLIRSAANAARAFSVVHESGHVIGDVKHDNLLVGAQATVRLVDCDSYQITWNGSRWFCEVGTPTHQPPELQNIRTYRGLVRTPNHDNFGLAVIIFQMLFMARHPFSGRFLGTGEMPMERAISEYRFVYGSNAAAIQMEHPPASLGLDGVTRDLALLFERAFSRQGSQPNGRPRPDEWVTALQDLEKHLRTCGVNSAHQFTDILNSCPWCEIEAVTGAPLFQVPVMGSAQVGLTIAALWAKVNSVPNPGPSPPLPSVGGLTITLSPAALELQRVGFGGKLASGLLSLIGAPSRIHSWEKEIGRKAVDARNRWQNLQNNWENYTSSKEFQDRLADLQDLRSQYDALPQKRLQELRKLDSNRYRLQLHTYLDGCRIAHARIKGVGVAKKAMLQSYGIETAADIIDHRVLAVPGFGPVLLSTLKQWRDQQQRRFVFDPNKGVDQITKNAVERQILTEKVDLERKLHEGLSKLSFSSNQILTRRRAVLAQAEQAVRDRAQAEADLQVSSGVSAPGRRAIAGLGAISVVGLIVASLLSKGPPAIAPQRIELQTMPTH
jgi:DNA-binding helix-hairpin-helix protein with protein kinase domain